MRLGKQLSMLVSDLRSECGISQVEANNIQATGSQVALLQQTQQRLYDDHEWPHLRVRRPLALVSGQRFYEPPADISIERIEGIDVLLFGSEEPYRLKEGVELRHMARCNSNRGETDWPPRRWRFSEDYQIELWPVPTAAGAEDMPLVEVVGIRKLGKFVDMQDRASIDGRLITLFAAAELLAATDKDLASMKLAQAQKRLSTLRGQEMRPRTFSMFGDRHAERCAPRRTHVREYR